MKKVVGRGGGGGGGDTLARFNRFFRIPFDVCR